MMAALGISSFVGFRPFSDIRRVRIDDVPGAARGPTMRVLQNRYDVCIRHVILELKQRMGVDRCYLGDIRNMRTAEECERQAALLDRLADIEKDNFRMVAYKQMAAYWRATAKLKVRPGPK